MNLNDKIKAFLLRCTYAQKLAVVLFCTFLSFLFIAGGLYYSSYGLYRETLIDKRSFPIHAKVNRILNLVVLHYVEGVYAKTNPEKLNGDSLEKLGVQIDEEIQQFISMVSTHISTENLRLFAPRIRYHVDEVNDLVKAWQEYKKNYLNRTQDSQTEKFNAFLAVIQKVQTKIRDAFNFYENDDEGAKRLIDVNFTTIPQLIQETAIFFESVVNYTKEAELSNGDLYGVALNVHENITKMKVQLEGISKLIDSSLEKDTRNFFETTVSSVLDVSDTQSRLVLGDGVPDTAATYDYAKNALEIYGKAQESLNEFLAIMNTKQSASLFYRLYIGYALVFLALFTVLLIYFARVVLQPLKSLSDAANELAIGKVNTRVPIIKHDEVGEISEAFNALAAFLENTLREVKGVANGLLESVQVILGVARQLEQNIAVQDAELYVVKGHIKEIAVVVKEFSVLLNNVYKSINATAGFADVGRKSLSEMEHVMKKIVSASQSIVSTLNKLNVKIGSINDVISTIVNIADQINLLSLNTAIQANKAGPEGKGFTIIAKKIRELSGQTAFSTLGIEETVREIVNTVDFSTTNVNKFLDQVLLQVKDSVLLSEEFKNLIHFFQHQVEVFSSVNEDMAKQSESATDLQEVLRGLSNASKRTTVSVGQFYREIESLHQSTNSLVEKIDSFTHPSYILLAAGHAPEELSYKPE